MPKCRKESNVCFRGSLVNFSCPINEREIKMAHTEQLVSGWITVRGTLAVLLLSVLLYASCSEAAEAADFDKADETSTFITFVPVSSKMRELLRVDLVRPNDENRPYYDVLQSAILASKLWRRERDGDVYNIPGRCKVEALASEWYFMKCDLDHAGVPRRFEEKVKGTDAVITLIQSFSRTRTLPSPRPLKKERGAVSTKLA